MSSLVISDQSICTGKPERWDSSKATSNFEGGGAPRSRTRLSHTHAAPGWPGSMNGSKMTFVYCPSSDGSPVKTSFAVANIHVVFLCLHRVGLVTASASSLLIDLSRIAEAMHVVLMRLRGFEILGALIIHERQSSTERETTAGPKERVDSREPPVK
ncbi:hypothetical protein BJ546DRAFT_353974 [Cryomyces antarcticus]